MQFNLKGYDMDISFDTEQQQYKFITALKKTNPKFVAGGVLFNQQVLIACGKIDTTLNQLLPTKRKQFVADNQKFFAGFAWLYYQDWREMRAKSCAHLMDVYKLLNVKLKLDDFVGETFYAGIPKVISGEVNNVIDKHNTDEFSCEKIGIDGKLHPCDSYGEFLELTDFNDIYGDGTMVTKQELASKLTEYDDKGNKYGRNGHI